MAPQTDTKTAKEKKHKYETASEVVVMPDGSHKQVKAYGKSKREAKSKLKLKVAQIQRGETVTNGHTPALQYFREWLEKGKKDGKRKVADATYNDYAGRIKNHMGPVFEGLSLDKVQPCHCEQVLNRIKGGSQSDINKTYQLLRSGFRAAVDNGLLLRSPMAGISKPKGTTGKRRSLTAAEYDRLRAAIGGIMQDAEADHAAAAYAAIAVGCGLRPGEVAALRWSNIKLQDQGSALTVAGAVKKGTRIIDSPKTEAGRRTVGVPSWLAAILRQYKAEQAAKVAAGNADRAERLAGLQWLNIPADNVEFMLVFPDKLRSGQPTSEGRRRAMFKGIREAARLPEDIDLYCLRHTYCTRGAKAGVDLRTMRYLMGHESIEITARIYTDITDEMQADAAAAFEALENMI